MAILPCYLSHLLKGQHFADDSAWIKSDAHCSSEVYEWCSECNCDRPGHASNCIGEWIKEHRYARTRHQDRHDMLEEQIARTEALRSHSNSRSSCLPVDARQHNASELQNLLSLYPRLDRVRLSSSGFLPQDIEKNVRAIYPQPSPTAEQIESRSANGKNPLRQFSDRCRTEPDSLQEQL
jgi:hypothetical protein